MPKKRKTNEGHLWPLSAMSEGELSHRTGFAGYPNHFDRAFNPLWSNAAKRMIFEAVAMLHRRGLPVQSDWLVDTSMPNWAYRLVEANSGKPGSALPDLRPIANAVRQYMNEPVEVGGEHYPRHPADLEGRAEANLILAAIDFVYLAEGGPLPERLSRDSQRNEGVARIEWAAACAFEMGVHAQCLSAFNAGMVIDHAVLRERSKKAAEHGRDGAQKSRAARKPHWIEDAKKDWAKSKLNLNAFSEHHGKDKGRGTYGVTARRIREVLSQKNSEI